MALGGLGVDLFFVLSGFLITTLLVQEAKKTERVSLPRFWARRALRRLMPAYWLYAGFITFSIYVMHWGWMKPEYGGWTPAGFVASIWLYFINYLPMGGLWEHQELVVHFWTLAIEEQFYFLWPILFFFVFPATADRVGGLGAGAGDPGPRYPARPESSPHSGSTREAWES